MGFLVSPGVQVREIDLTNVVPAVSTSIGAIAGPFEKGPVSTVTAISSEQELVQVFGKPQGDNFEFFFTAANFLQYGDALRVVRVESGIVNAVASGSAILIRDTDHYLNAFSTGQASVGEWAARTAGTHGNGIGVSICGNATAYEQNLGSSNQTVGEDAAGATVVKVDDGTAFSVGDLISFSSADASTTATNFAFNTGDEGNEYEITAISTHDLTVRLKDDPNSAGLQATIPDNSFIRRRWRFYDLFDAAPGTSQWATDNGRGSGDELHVCVYDTTGDLTGFDVDTAGNRTNGILETFANMSKNPVAKTAQGGSNYYPDVIYRQSEYIYWMDHTSSGTNWGTDTTSAYTCLLYTSPSPRDKRQSRMPSSA